MFQGKWPVILNKYLIFVIKYIIISIMFNDLSEHPNQPSYPQISDLLFSYLSSGAQ